MTSWVPRDPLFAERVRESFERQAFMAVIGAKLAKLEPGHVELELAYRGDLTQQHGYLHAGIIATIGDTAGGYAAYSLMPAESTILTVEYKMNLMAPARGERFVATGRVIKSGRTLTVCRFEVQAHGDGKSVTCAWGLQTLMCLENRPDRPAGG